MKTTYLLDETGYRRKHLENILLGTSIITRASLADKRFFDLEKISSDVNSASNIEAYKELRRKCDEKAYSVKWLDDIGDKITSAISPAIKPIAKGIGALVRAGEGATNQSTKVVTEIAGKTASDILAIDRKYKIAKIYNSNFDDFSFIENQILIVAKENGIRAKSLEELSMKINAINKQAGVAEVASKGLSMIGQGIKGLGKGLGKATLRSLPFVGIVTDLTIMSKNLYEAWINGKKIISDLPLEKYGINTSDALIPTPGNTTSISRTLEALTIEHKESPSQLSEILEIAQTLKGYATDFVSTITNLIMSLLDLLDFVPGVGPLVSILLSIPFMAVEMGNDTLVEESYDKSINNIRQICDQKIMGGGTEISSEQKDFMKEFLASNTEEAGATEAAPASNSRTASLQRIYNSLSLK